MRGDSVSMRFLEAMRYELFANEHKGDWLGGSRRHNLRELDYHVAKLKAAARAGDTTRVLEFSADVGNQAMILADQEGALFPEVLKSRRAETQYVRPSFRIWLSLAIRTPRWVPTVATSLACGLIRHGRTRSRRWLDSLALRV